MITRNRGKHIHVALDHLLALAEKPNVIVVDNASSDDTREALRKWGSRIEVVHLDQNMGGAGRNVGVSRAKTPYVAFSDDDSWWAHGALRRAADYFDAHPNLGLIHAKILVGINKQPDPLCYIMAKNTLSQQDPNSCSTVGVPIVGFAACGAVVRRTAFLQAGGFEQHFGVGGEECILALDLLRHGWQLAYIENIVAYHHPSPLRDLAKRTRQIVRNAFWVAWLRRPFRTAFAETWRLIQKALKDKYYRAGLVDAILGLSWVIAARNPVSIEIDRQVRIA